MIDPTPEKDILEDLFNRAQPRKRPPEEVERELFVTLHSEWHDQLARRRTRRAGVWGLAASFVAAAIIVGYQFAQKPQAGATAVTIATVERVHGELLSWGNSNSGLLQTLNASHVFKTGQTLTSGSGSRVALRYGHGGSLRMDENTKVVFVGPDLLELRRGSIYFDSPPEEGTPPTTGLKIRTAFGAVSHLGTQFMVDVSRDALSVSVREGKVLIENAVVGRTTTEIGEQFTLRRDRSYDTKKFPIYGELWQWTESIAPKFEQAGRSYYEFLEWVERETGRKVQYVGIAEETAKAHNITIHVDEAPTKALSLLLEVEPLLSYKEEGSLILVSTGTT